MKYLYFFTDRTVLVSDFPPMDETLLSVAGVEDDDDLAVTVVSVDDDGTVKKYVADASQLKEVDHGGELGIEVVGDVLTTWVEIEDLFVEDDDE